MDRWTALSAVPDRTDLPSRIFVFMEAYCAEPRCDCRRVMLNVIDAETQSHVATLNISGVRRPSQPAA